ncbi:hypothetical protein WNY56_12335 [Celeribacter marinus]|jgi:transposase
MTKMTDDTIGIDISKARLDIHRLSDAKTMSFGNCPTGFKSLARFCAKMGNTFALEPDMPAPQIQHDLKELRAFRSGLIKDRTSIMNRLKTQKLSITCRQSKTRLAQVVKQIAEISAEVNRLIKANNTLAQSIVRYVHASQILGPSYAQSHTPPSQRRRRIVGS